MQIQQMPESNQTTFPLNNFAERRGFEPRKPFWSLHAFQACLFNHSSISPILLLLVKRVQNTKNFPIAYVSVHKSILFD